MVQIVDENHQDPVLRVDLPGIQLLVHPGSHQAVEGLDVEITLLQAEQDNFTAASRRLNGVVHADVEAGHLHGYVGTDPTAGLAYVAHELLVRLGHAIEIGVELLGEDLAVIRKIILMNFFNS